MYNSLRTLAAVAALVLAAPALSQAEAWRDPVYRDMFNQLHIKYGEQPGRNLPADSVSTAGKKVKISRFDPAIDSLANPVSRPTEKQVAQGQLLFETYCFPCHGKQGKGDGPIASKGMPGPDLTMDFYKQKSDGFFWATILQGTGAMMPAQAEALSQDDAWQIVNYLRSLQK